MTGPVITLLGVAFVLAGIGIGSAETAEHAAIAAFAPPEIRGSAFGLLATVQAGDNLAASAMAGLFYTFTSPAIAFGYLAAWMLHPRLGHPKQPSELLNHALNHVGGHCAAPRRRRYRRMSGL